MTRSIAHSALLCAALFLGWIASGRADPIEPREISAEQFRAISAAVPELDARGLDLSRYKISFWDEGTSTVVLFTDRNLPPELQEGMRGSPPPPWAPSFGVEVSRIDCRVLKANFQR